MLKLRETTLQQLKPCNTKSTTAHKNSCIVQLKYVYKFIMNLESNLPFWCNISREPLKLKVEKNNHSTSHTHIIQNTFKHLIKSTYSTEWHNKQKKQS